MCFFRIKKLLPIALTSILLAGVSLYAQNNPTQKAKKSCGCPFDNVNVDVSFYNEPLFTADEKPSFPGGETALKNYINRLIQHPANNAEDSAKYNVFCLFVVETDGSISHPKILHHSDSIFEKEALRFIETMPRWIPGKTEGETIRCWHSINLFFGYPQGKKQYSATY